MGRNTAVTYEQVAAAAEQLQTDGLTPSAKLIRTRLGDIGSLGTIQKHVMDWRAGQGEAHPATRMLTPEIQRAVFRFVDEEVSRINGELKQQVEQATREMAELAADNEEQTSLVRQLRTELEEQVAFKNKQDGQLSRLLDELKAAHDETAAARHEAELARHELTRIQSRLEAQAPLERELSQLRTDFEAERSGRVRAEQNEAVLKVQKDILEARVAELKETASPSSHSHSASAEGHAGKSPQRPFQASTRRARKQEDSGVPSTSDLADAPEATVPDAAPYPDPRQGTLLPE